MFEAYKIGISIKLIDLISPGLMEMSRRLAKMDGLVSALNLNLKEVGASEAGFKAVANSSRTLDRYLTGAVRNSELLAANLARIKGISILPDRPRTGGGSVHLGKDGIGMSPLAYGIGGDAMLPLAAGAAGFYLTKTSYESAKDFQTQAAKFKLFGLTEKQNAEAINFAKNTRIPGTSATQLLMLVNEAQGVFRESGLVGSDALKAAELAAPIMAKIRFATSTLDDESAAKLNNSSLDMLRFTEMRTGLKSPQAFIHAANEGWKAIKASGGNVDWSQYRQFMRIGGVAAQGLSDDALYGKLEPVIGELKGQSSGFGLRTAYNRMHLGIGVTRVAAAEMFRTGLWDKHNVIFNSMGGVKRFKPGKIPLLHAEEWHRDPMGAYEKYLKPMYDKLGIITPNQIAAENARMFGSTGGMLYTLIDRQLALIKASEAAQKKALAIDPSVKVAASTASGAEKEFTAAWSDFKRVFGDSALPQITAMLKNGAELLRTINAFSVKYKGFMDTLEAVTGGASTPGVVKVIKRAAEGIWDFLSPDDHSKFVPKNTVSGKIRHGDVYIDGKKAGAVLAPHVSAYQARSANRPQAGQSTHDGSMSLTSVLGKS